MYFQTWTWNEKLRRWPIIGSRLFRFVQLACGYLTKHPPSATEWGYGGGEYVDVWCRWCDKSASVTITEASRRWPMFMEMRGYVDRQQEGQ